MSKQISTRGQREDDLVSSVYDVWGEGSPMFHPTVGNYNLPSLPPQHPPMSTITRSNYDLPPLPSQLPPMNPVGGNYDLPPLPPQLPPMNPIGGNYDLPPLPPQLPPMNPIGGNYDLPPLPPQLPMNPMGGYYDLPPLPPQLSPMIITRNNYHLVPLPPQHSPMNLSGGNYNMPPISQQIQIPPQPHLRPSPQPAPVMYYTSEPHVFSATRCNNPTVSVVPSQPKPTDKKKRPAQPNSVGGIKKRGHWSSKTIEQIETLRDIIPYPPKAEAVSVLADVVDYLTPLKQRVEELRKEKARRQALQQSALQQSAEDYERERQRKGKGILETTSSSPDE